MIHQKSGKLNKGADVLSKTYLSLSILVSGILGFEKTMELYNVDENFKELIAKSSAHPLGTFHL